MGWRTALGTMLAWALCSGCGNTEHGSKAEPKPDASKPAGMTFACKAEVAVPWQRLGRPPYQPICAIARDPLHPKAMLGLNALGLFSSADEGDSWCELDSNLTLPPSGELGRSVLRLAASEAYPSKLFADVGQLGQGYLLTRQADGSLTSQQTSSSNVRVDPFDATRLYALAPFQLAVSVDGEQFEKVSASSGPNLLIAFELDSNTRNAVYGVDEQGTFWRSDDAGQSWVARNVDDAAGTQHSLSVINDGGTIIYLSPVEDDHSWRSADGGLTFAKVPILNGEIFAPEAVDEWGGTCGLPVFDPADEKNVILPTQLGLIDVKGAAVGLRPNRLLPELDMLESRLTKATSDNVHFAVTLGGLLFVSANEALDFDPVELDGSLEDAAFEPGAANLFAWGRERNSVEIARVQYSTNFGKTFDSFDCPDCAALQIDALAPSTVYAAHLAGSGDSAVDACWFSRSQDLGATWTCIWPPQNEVRELCGGDYPPAYDRCSNVVFATSPQDSRILFVLSSGGIPARIGKSTDGGSSWTRVGPELTSSPGSQASWALNPSAPERLLVSGAVPAATWLSDDAGETWTQLNDTFADLLGVARGAPDTYFAVPWTDRSSGGLSRSDDAGASWANIGKELPSCVKGDEVAMLPTADASELYARACRTWFKTNPDFEAE